MFFLLQFIFRDSLQPKEASIFLMPGGENNPVTRWMILSSSLFWRLMRLYHDKLPVDSKQDAIAIWISFFLFSGRLWITSKWYARKLSTTWSYFNAAFSSLILCPRNQLHSYQTTITMTWWCETDQKAKTTITCGFCRFLGVEKRHQSSLMICSSWEKQRQTLC